MINKIETKHTISSSSCFKMPGLVKIFLIHIYIICAFSCFFMVSWFTEMRMYSRGNIFLCVIIIFVAINIGLITNIHLKKRFAPFLCRLFLLTNAAIVFVVAFGFIGFILFGWGFHAIGATAFKIAAYSLTQIVYLIAWEKYFKNSEKVQHYFNTSNPENSESSSKQPIGVNLFRFFCYSLLAFSLPMVLAFLMIVLFRFKFIEIWIEDFKIIENFGHFDKFSIIPMDILLFVFFLSHMILSTLGLVLTHRKNPAILTFLKSWLSILLFFSFNLIFSYSFEFELSPPYRTDILLIILSTSYWYFSEYVFKASDDIYTDINANQMPTFFVIAFFALGYFFFKYTRELIVSWSYGEMFNIILYLLGGAWVTIISFSFYCFLLLQAKAKHGPIFCCALFVISGVLSIFSSGGAPFALFRFPQIFIDLAPLAPAFFCFFVAGCIAYSHKFFFVFNSDVSPFGLNKCLVWLHKVSPELLIFSWLCIALIVGYLINIATTMFLSIYHNDPLHSLLFSIYKEGSINFSNRSLNFSNKSLFINEFVLLPILCAIGCIYFSLFRWHNKNILLINMAFLLIFSLFERSMMHAFLISVDIGYSVQTLFISTQPLAIMIFLAWWFITTFSQERQFSPIGSSSLITSR